MPEVTCLDDQHKRTPFPWIKHKIWLFIVQKIHLWSFFLPASHNILILSQNWWSNTNRPLLTLKITVFGGAEVHPTTTGFEKQLSTPFWPKRALIGLHNRQHQGWRRGKIQWPKKMWREKPIISFCARRVSPALPSRGHRKPHVEMERGEKYVL